MGYPTVRGQAVAPACRVATPAPPALPSHMGTILATGGDSHSTGQLHAICGVTTLSITMWL